MSVNKRSSLCAGKSRAPALGAAHQSGVALFISLVLLLVLTIAGVSAVQTTSLEERMARNSHDGLLAFLAAETAIQEAEDFVETSVDLSTVFSPTGASGLWAVASFGEEPVWEDYDIWDEGSGATQETTASVPEVAQQPRYMIEYVAQVVEENVLVASDEEEDPPIIHMYRITAVGTGGSNNSRVILQSVYGKFL